MTEKKRILQQLELAEIQLQAAIDICNSETIDLWEIHIHLQVAEERIMNAMGDLTAISMKALRESMKKSKPREFKATDKL